MDKLNKEIDDMYNELTAEEPEATQKTFDFTAIRDNFRLHIHNRRNLDSPDVILLDEPLLLNLLALKQKSFELLRKFKSISEGPSRDNKVKTFSSFEEFVNFVVTQKEILNSELWKIEAICGYLEQLELHNTSHESFNNSHGL